MKYISLLCFMHFLLLLFCYLFGKQGISYLLFTFFLKKKYCNRFDFTFGISQIYRLKIKESEILQKMFLKNV